MPHKHKRKREDDPSDHDLPPSSRARALTVHQKSESIFTSDAAKKEKLGAKRARKRGAKNADDTPKAFARLMAWQSDGKRRPNGLDDGVSKKPTKSQKTKTKAAPEAEADAEPAPDAAAPPTAAPTILPGESLRDFSLRVDQSLPLASVPRATAPGVKLKTTLTKHNKRLARMQAEWRATEAKVQAARAEADDERLDAKEEDDLLWGEARSVRRKKGKWKSGQTGAGGVDEGNIWAKVGKKKDKKEARLGGLNAAESAVAPPVLKGVKNIFKAREERKGG